MSKRKASRAAIVLGVLGLLLLMGNCAPAPRCFSTKKSNPPRYPKRDSEFVSARVSSQMQEGICSYSAHEQHGTPMANGEKYDMYRMVAAHRTMPFGTVVRVTNLQNGRSVDVEIRDRGPFVSGRIIDVSYAAALKLGMVRQGVIPARLEPVAGEWRVEEEKPDLLARAKEEFDKLVDRFFNRN